MNCGLRLPQISGALARHAGTGRAFPEPLRLAGTSCRALRLRRPSSAVTAVCQAWSCQSWRRHSSSRHKIAARAVPDPDSAEDHACVRLAMQNGSSMEWHYNRRDALYQVLSAAAFSGADSFRWMWHPYGAEAALLQFPTTSLRNTYYLACFVRAGEAESEAQGFVLTNPVAKTSMSSGLSARGKLQVAKGTSAHLKALDACSDGCWLWPSITQRCYQTAEILGSLLGVGQSRIVPEYSFLDPRGLGALEGLSWETAERQVSNGDRFSPEWRPQKGTDGTPNESIADVLVRVRQVMSITETQYSGESVIIISPDSDNLSILQAALLGLDLRQHKEFAFQPGEVRMVELSTTPVDYSPRTFACPRPPACI